MSKPKDDYPEDRTVKCGLCGCEHDESINAHGDCLICARAQYE